MRLIDADALLSELQTKFDRAERDAYFTGNREIRIGWDDAIRAIKQAKTVEAIPIEWLKERYMDGHKQTWSAVVYDALLTILKAWEKENENE